MSRRIRQIHQRRLQGEQRRLPAQGTGGGPAVAVLYPNQYSVGMANLGFHALLEQLQQYPGLQVDRCFLPGRAEMPEHRRSGTPVLGLESGRSLAQFDLLLCSISFEPDALGLVQMLQLSGLQPLARRRGGRDPLVVAGGMAPTLNPEPLAPICDLLGLGEAEALLPALLELLLQRPNRLELLQQAAQCDGWYAPRDDKTPAPVRRLQAPLERPCMPVVLGRGAAFGSHVDLEISRGCRWRCAFCAAGHVVSPYRELQLEALEPALSWALSRRQRVGLVGTDVSDHSGLGAIAGYVRDHGGDVALPSLRVEQLADPDSAASRIITLKPPRTVTMAVEHATENTRRRLHKQLTDETIGRAAALLAGAGVVQLKVYLLAAIPGERWAEVEAIPALVQDLLRHGPGGRLTLSVTGMVPKPGTPMQWEPAPDRAYLRRVRRYLREQLPRPRVELSFESPDWTRWQALLSLGGREVAEYLLLASRDGWRRALSQASDQQPLLQGQGRAADDVLPWSHVDHGCRVRRFGARERH